MIFLGIVSTLLMLLLFVLAKHCRNQEAMVIDAIDSGARANRLVDFWKERHEHSQSTNLEMVTALSEAHKALDASRAVVQGVERAIGCDECVRAVPQHLCDVVEAMGEPEAQSTGERPIAAECSPVSGWVPC